MVCLQQMEIYSYIDISDNDETKCSGEVEIYETLDVSEETKTSEELDNQITQKLFDTQYSGDSE